MDVMLDAGGAAALLNIGEKELKGFVANKIIPAYMIAGKFLRFKKSELEALRDMLKLDAGSGDERIFNKAFSEVKGLEKFKEVLRANDIYLIIGIAIFVILIFMFFNLGR